MFQTPQFITGPAVAQRVHGWSRTGLPISTERLLRPCVDRALRVGASLLVLMTVGCTQSGSTALPRPTTPPSKLATYTGTLQPMATNFYAITITNPGYVEATLVGLGGPPATTVGLGIGNLTASGTCALIYSVTTPAGMAAQVVGTGLSGTLCVTIYDVGNLTAPTLYTITVASS
jgi:hypothetical protein